MKLDITDVHLIELHKKGYTVDMVLILSWVNRNLSIDHIIEGSAKLKALHSTMVRKGLLTEENKITKIGIEILDFVSKKTNKKFDKPKVETSEFDEWWAIFPPTDIFTYRGKKFEGTRSLRTSKSKCALLFNKMILDGKYTKDEIINATMYDVELKKKNSMKKGSNQLTFLQNSATYLHNESFSAFIKFGKPKIESNKSKLGSIDI